MEGIQQGETFGEGRKLAAWGVHLYTALGLPLGFLAVEALAAGDASRFFLIAAIACAVDATDGFMARAVRVKDVLPDFSGRRLDDLVDFLHFVLLPALAVVALGMLPREQAALVVLPVMASAYGFCQEQAKTEDSFVGFPSYWNILVLYMYVLDASPTVVAAVLIVFSLLIFVPIHYVYPSRTRLMRPVTVVLGLVWTAAMFAISMAPEAPWAHQVAFASLYYPLYYIALSAVHHTRVTQRLQQG